MAEPRDMDGRTEAPTPARRREAREQGRVARSADLGAALLLLAALGLLQAWGPGLMQRLIGMQERWLGRLAAPQLDAAGALGMFAEAAWDLALALGPLAAGIWAAAAAASLLQVGFRFSSLRPAFPGFRGLVSGPAWTRLAMGALKLLAVGWTAWRTLAEQAGAIAALAGMTLPAASAAAGGMALLLGLRVALVLLFLGLLDYAARRWEFERELRMTRREVEEELKRLEGDPGIRARRKRMARELAGQRLLREVPAADAVVAGGPALALAFDARTMAAPRLLCKGEGLLAARILALAEAHAVPVLRNRSLARSLFRDAEAGREIPERHWDAVIGVLGRVYRLDGARASRWGLEAVHG